MIDCSITRVSFTWRHSSRFAYVPEQNGWEWLWDRPWKRSKRFKAEIWKHFGFYQQAGKHKLDKSAAICKDCHTNILYVGNTTNLRIQFSRFHPELLATTPAAENANPGPVTLRDWCDYTTQLWARKDNNPVYGSLQSKRFTTLFHRGKLGISVYGEDAWAAVKDPIT